MSEGLTTDDEIVTVLQSTIDDHIRAWRDEHAARTHLEAEVERLKAREESLLDSISELNSFDAPAELVKERAEVRRLRAEVERLGKEVYASDCVVRDAGRSIVGLRNLVAELVDALEGWNYPVPEQLLSRAKEVLEVECWT